MQKAMLSVFGVLTLAVCAMNAHAGTASCSAFVSSGMQFFTGTCSNGFCSGFMPPQIINADGNCSDGTTFMASSTSPGAFFTGQCNGSYLYGFMPVSNVMFSGSCGHGGSFSGNAFMSGGSVSGSCQKNGWFSAQAFGSQGSVDGTCNSADDLELNDAETP